MLNWSSRLFKIFVPLATVILALWALPVYALNTCYAVADSGNALVSLDKTSGETVFIGKTGVLNIEAIAFKPDTQILYATDEGILGTINLASGQFTAIGALGTANGSLGVMTMSNVDGLSWDGNRFFGVQRRGSADLLFQINPTTGLVLTGTFNGADYVPIASTTLQEDDVEDISFNPQTGILYGVFNNDSSGGTLAIINSQTGAISETGVLSDSKNSTNIIDNIEGLSFFNNGELYGSTGDNGPDLAERNKLFSIEITTGRTTLVGAFPAQYGDYEALACLTANIADDDEDSIVNSGEDINGDGNLENDDSDGDTIPNYLDADDDGDNILTLREDLDGDKNVLSDDTDKDAIPNYLDKDDDNDGVLSKAEDSNNNNNPQDDDADSDGVPDYLEPNNVDLDGDTKMNQFDSDDDGDGIPSRTESTIDSDGDKTPNYLDLNSDADEIADSAEWSTGISDPLKDCTAGNAVCFNNNVDGDALPNYIDLDSDNDTLLDKNESTGDDDQDGIPNWIDANTNLQFIYLPVVAKQ